MRASFYKAGFVVAGAEAPKPTGGDFLRLEVQLKAIFFAAELPAKPSEEVIGIGFALQGSKPVAPAKPAQSVLGSSKNAVKAALPSQAFTPVTPSVSFASLISPGAAPARPVLCAASTSAAAPTVIKPFSDAPCASINNGQGWTLVSRAAKANKKKPISRALRSSDHKTRPSPRRSTRRVAPRPAPRLGPRFVPRAAASSPAPICHPFRTAPPRRRARSPRHSPARAVTRPLFPPEDPVDVVHRDVNIFIQDLAGKNISLQVGHTETVCGLKSTLASRWDFPLAHMFRLAFQGKGLREGTNLHDYGEIPSTVELLRETGIGQDATIRSSVRVRGGAEASSSSLAVHTDGAPDDNADDELDEHVLDLQDAMLQAGDDQEMLDSVDEVMQELAEILDDSPADTVSPELVALVAPTPQESVQLIVEAIDRAESRPGVGSAWQKAVRGRSSTQEEVDDTRRRAVERANARDVHVATVGATNLGPILPNGSETAAVIMMAYWAPPHQGQQVLFPDNYTMRPFILKGFDGTGLTQAAFDYIEQKCSRRQHRNIPIWKKGWKWDRDFDKFADQFLFFDEGFDDVHVTRRFVRDGLQHYRHVISTATREPSFLFIQGVPAQEAVFHHLDSYPEPGYRVVTLHIDVPIPPMEKVDIPAGQTSHIVGRYVIREDTGDVTAVFLGIPHASYRSYAVALTDAHSVATGIALDFVSNAAVCLSGRDVPQSRQNLFMDRFSPAAMMFHPKAMTRGMVKLRAEEARRMQANPSFRYAPDTIPREFRNHVVDNGLSDPPMIDSRGKPHATWLGAVVGAHISNRRSLMSKEQKEQAIAKMIATRKLNYDPAVAKVVSAKSWATMAAWPSEKKAAYTLEKSVGMARSHAEREGLQFDEDFYRANYQPKEPKKPALIHQVSDDAEGVRYIVARAPSGSSPSYRIAILEELLKKPHSPIDPRDPGMTVSCGIWQKISNTFTSWKGTSKRKGIAGERRDAEPWYCKAKDIVYLRGVSRDPKDNIVVPKGGCYCLFCGADCAPAGKALPREACGPYLAFKRIVRPDIVNNLRVGPGDMALEHMAVRLCEDADLPDIRAVLALSPGGPGPSTAGSPIEVASPTIVETAGFFEMTEEETDRAEFNRILQKIEDEGWTKEDILANVQDIFSNLAV